MKKYKSPWQKIALISSAAVALLSTFLPWVSGNVLGFTFSYSTWGYPGFGPLFAIIFLLASATIITLSSLALGLKKDQVAFGGYLSGIIGGAIMFLVTVIFFADAAATHLIDYLGFGLWLAIIAVIATIVFGILGLAITTKPKKAKKSSDEDDEEDE